VAIITVSDKGSRGERADTSGPALKTILEADGWSVVHSEIVPDDIPDIKAALINCADNLKLPLVLTTGGTGFTQRDNTPEATKAVIERETPGFPELMRAESFKLTPNGILSRAAAGIRGETIIINLPGSERAAKECLGFILKPLKHAIIMTANDSVEHNK
jgi:molybdenum cofactor synthesis domain-containing protein